MKNLFILAIICLLCTISAMSQSKKEWEKVQSLNSWNVYQQFLLNYPNGKYTEQAKQKQALLKQPEAVTKIEEKKVVVEVPVEKSIVAAPTAFTQNNDPIVLKKKRYYLNNKQLNNKELKGLLLSKQESAYEYKKASTNIAIGTAIIGAGTALCLYGTAVSLKQSVNESNAISDGNLYYQSDQSKFVTPILIGAGLVLVGIPFVLSSNQHLKKSITIYNSKQTATGYRNELKLDIRLTQNGIGVTYHF